MGQVTESIFSGKTHIIPMADVHHIERDMRGGYEDSINVVMNGTTWNSEIDAYNNSVCLRHEEAKSFLRCWCRYRSELEADQIIGIAQDEVIPGTTEALNKLGI